MVVTSKTSSIILDKLPGYGGAGSSSQSEKVFIGTRVTRLGPDGDYQYDVDILQYSKSSEGGFVSPKVIGKRDSGNPNKITWNDNAPDIVKKSWNNTKIVNTVKDQMRSMEKDFVQSSQNIEDYRRENGFRSYGKDTFPEDTSTSLPDNGSTAPKAPTVTGFKYPFDMDIDNQDILKIEAYERTPRDLATGTDTSSREKGLGIPKGQIILPINGQVSTDSMTVNYDENPLNIIQAALAANINQAIAGEGKSVDEASPLGGIMKKLNVSREDLKQFIGAAAGASAANALSGNTVDINALTSRLNGTILNPNLELLFKSPQLRSFSFQYLMLPRDSDEAKQVIGILRMLKSNMVPKLERGTYFLRTPNIFKLQYMKGGSPHPFLNKFKMCALRSCDVQYAPLGTYATFFDGVMHAYRLTMQFTELDPVYDVDYEDTTGGMASFREDAAEQAALNAKAKSSSIGF